MGMYCDVIFEKCNNRIGAYSYRINIIPIFFDSNIFVDIRKNPDGMEFYICCGTQ
jgi:hypothetical protein